MVMQVNYLVPEGYLQLVDGGLKLIHLCEECFIIDGSTKKGKCLIDLTRVCVQQFLSLSVPIFWITHDLFALLRLIFLSDELYLLNDAVLFHFSDEVLYLLKGDFRHDPLRHPP
jgi:hypothetical protein